MLQKTLPKIALSFDTLMVYSWISFHYYPPTFSICECYSSTIGIYFFYSLGRMVWLFHVSRGPDWVWVFRPHPKTMSISNLVRGETKGRTFCSVILRPWVWVWPAIAPGFKPPLKFGTQLISSIMELTAGGGKDDQLN